MPPARHLGGPGLGILEFSLPRSLECPESCPVSGHFLSSLDLRLSLSCLLLSASCVHVVVQHRGVQGHGCRSGSSRVGDRRSGLQSQSVETISIAPHSSQCAHIARVPFRPAAHATRSFGICEQELRGESTHRGEQRSAFVRNLFAMGEVCVVFGIEVFYNKFWAPFSYVQRFKPQSWDITWADSLIILTLVIFLQYNPLHAFYLLRQQSW